MRGLDDVDGACSRSYGDSETKEEASGHELVDRGGKSGCARDDGADNDDERADEHANTSTPSIDGWTDEWKGTDSANLIHGADKSSPDLIISLVSDLFLSKIHMVAATHAIVAATEEVKKLGVGGQTAKKRAVEAVHGLAAESDHGASEEKQHPRMKPVGLFSKQSFVVSPCALCDFDIGDLTDL